MKKVILTFTATLFIISSYSQNSNSFKGEKYSTDISGIFIAKEYSQDMSLYKAKSFLMTEILIGSEDILQFQIYPLAGASSGDLTSLVYECKTKNSEGLILGFYDDYVYDRGTIYKAYAYKNLPKEKAIELLNKISETKDKNSSYLFKDVDNNNLFFRYDDLVILISMTIGQSAITEIRVFWGKFDAVWDITSFNKTNKRFEKSLK